MHRESGSRSGVADTLDSIAFAYGQLADYERAIAHYEQALAMYRLLGDPQGEAHRVAATSVTYSSPRGSRTPRGAAGSGRSRCSPRFPARTRSEATLGPAAGQPRLEACLGGSR